MADAGTPGWKGLIRCPLCFEDMENPKVLSCQHTYCTPCLTKIVTEDVIECPECRQQTSLDSKGVSGLVNSLIVNKVKSMLNNKNTICDFCRQVNEYGDTVAKWWCEKCNKNLCDRCKEKHTSKSIFMDHQVLDIEYIKCEVHQDQVIQYLCFGCKRCICSMCAMADCLHHDQEEISKQTCSVLINVTQAQIQVLEEIQAKNTVNIQQLKLDIDNHVKARITQIKKSGKSLKKLVNDKGDAFNEIIGGLIKKKENSINGAVSSVSRESNTTKLLALTNESFKSITCESEDNLLPSDLPCCLFEKDESNIVVGKVRVESCGETMNDALKVAVNIAPIITETPDSPKLGKMVWMAEHYVYNGVAFLPDGKLVAAAHGAKKVLLYGRAGTKLAEYSCGFSPEFVAYQAQENNVIAAGSGNKLIFLKPGNTLTVVKTITLSLEPCWGLAVLQDGSIATAHRDCSFINIQTTDGRILFKIDTPEIQPMRINEHCNCIYVIKTVTKGLYVYHHQGELLHKWTDDSKKYEAVAIDANGFILLTEMNNKCLTVLDNHGKMIAKIPVDMKPKFISIHGNRLCVTSDTTDKPNKGKICVYELCLS